HNLVLIGGIVSLHILGMYALSPLFGWTSDQFGPLRTGVAGLIILAAAVVLAMLAGHDAVWVGASLVLLGVGWSAATIAASSLLAGVDAGELRVPLQGATDALMNYAGAFAALVSAPLLAWLGFGGLSLVAGLLLIPGAVLGWGAHRWMRSAAPVR
ncbi:MAG: MFS transporter, partial [Propioniciclava sp.]